MATLRGIITEVLTTLETITDFKWVKVWNNQLNRMDDQSGLSLPFPACYIELVPQEYLPLAFGFSTSDLVWRVHICHHQLDAGNGNFDQNLDVYDLRDKVKNLLTLYKPTNCGSWISDGEEQDYEHDMVYHYILQFKCAFIDTKGSPYDPEYGTYIEKQPPTDLDVTYEEIEKDIFTDEFSDEFA
jgi:hypothetical protein